MSMFTKIAYYFVTVNPKFLQRSLYTLCTSNYAMKGRCCQQATPVLKATVVSNHFNSTSSKGKDTQIEYESSIKLLSKCLDDAMKDQNTHISLLVSSSLIQNFCKSYNSLSPSLQKQLLLFICDHYGVQHQNVVKSCDSLIKNAKLDSMDIAHLQSEDRLRFQLQPTYTHLFKLIGRLHDGVKFLTDLRYNTLEFASEASSPDSFKLRDFSNHLKNVLSIWFSVGLLNLTRITWETPADILEKIAKNEAVHSVRGWTDLKNRLGAHRRCYAFFHSSMPRDPLLLLHVALTNQITDDITDIVAYSAKPAIDGTSSDEKSTAMFYSITSTQKGLQGIEFGVHMIRAVVEELTFNLPDLDTFSSLSPIPRFKNWLLSRLTNASKTGETLFFPNELSSLKSHFSASSDSALLDQLRSVLAQNSWAQDKKATSLLKDPLLRLCAEYLHKVKIRGYAFDPVANFHLRNGATLWRINWMADPSMNGLSQSFGLMVNYRYYLDRMEGNSRQYILHQDVPVSSRVEAMMESSVRSVL